MIVSLYNPGDRNAAIPSPPHGRDHVILTGQTVLQTIFPSKVPRVRERKRKRNPTKRPRKNGEVYPCPPKERSPLVRRNARVYL